MRYLAYPKYKDSFVRWVGKIPIHWEPVRLKRKLKIINGATPQASEPQYWDGEITWVTPADFKFLDAGYITTSTRTITLEGLNSSGTSLVPSGSIVLTTRAPIGGVAQASGELCTNQGCKSLVHNAEDTHERFVFYVLTASTDQLNALGTGTTFMELSTNELGYYSYVQPPIEEQQQIAVFLDWKTGQIDALITKKEELLEKLKEKRLAVITQAVTKGLNPAATLRDSGISWLGQVPQHWEVKKLKFIGDSILGLTYDPEEITDEQNGTLVLRANNIQDGKLVASDTVYVNADVPAKIHLRLGDILICSRNGSRHLIGKCGRVTPEFVGCYFGAFNTVFRSQATDFIFYVLNSSLFEFQSGSYLTSTINQLTINTLNSFLVPLPPPEEQKQIAEFLDVQMARLDALANNAQLAIDHLTEYRTALITAATTGKIDVRNAKIGVVA